MSRYGGSGPPLALLHGHPRTHATWHMVAGRLAERFTVVCPDLRGYGGSSQPEELPGHETYSKRAMAGDVVRLMRSLGHRSIRPRRPRPRLLCCLPPRARPSRGGDEALLLESSAAARAARACRLAVRRELVALVLLRPDGQARRTRHQRRSGCLVSRDRQADGRGRVRRALGRPAQPAGRARHARGLPGRPRNRPRDR